MGGVWSLGLFGALKLAVVERHLLLPLLGLQRDAAAWYGSAPRALIDVTLDCSGADVIALCLGATLAYPTTWRWRLFGGAGGIAMILTLNTLRIATLGQVAGTGLFAPLHLYVWPGVLIFATVGYVAAWMTGAEGSWPVAVPGSTAFGRFAALTAMLVGLFIGLAPWFLVSEPLTAAALGIARSAGALLGALGVQAAVAGQVLMTRTGAYLVTPECVVTPLMPVYLAAVLTLPRTWARRLVGLVAGVPLFAGLALARLLTVALPPLVLDSPLVLTHAFYQILVAGLAVGVAAWWGTWESGRRAAARRGVIAAAVGLGGVLVAGSLYLGALGRLARAAGVAMPPDPQGALALLPCYQLGLFAALWLAAFGASGGRRLAAGVGILALSQLGLLMLLGSLGVEIRPTVPATLVRGWAVAGPVLVLGLARRKALSPAGPSLPPWSSAMVRS